MSCPADELSGLVDGALSHAERERVHAHLAGCDGCRAEVEAQRALKARLGLLGTATPDPSAELLARLRALAVPGVEPAATRPAPLPVGRAVPVRPRDSRPDAVRPRDGRPAAGPRPARRSGRARRTGAVGGGLLAVGVGLVLVLGGPVDRAPSTPVDPGSDAFVADFVSTTSEVPLADPAGRAALLPSP